MEQIPQINEHNKKEYPPMHTAEHILNATMVKMFRCSRSKNAHIERKKSKCDYLLEKEPSAEQIKKIEEKVNEVIGENKDVTVEYLSKQEAANVVDLSKLPENTSQMLRIVKVGDYDACACAGDHVENTSQIGEFKIISSEFTPAQEGETMGKWRVRFKLIENNN